jgi:hypothetical protein
LTAIAPTWVIAPSTLLAGLGGFFLGIVSRPDVGPLGATIITIAGTYIGASLALFYASGAIGWLRNRFEGMGTYWLADYCLLDRGDFLLDVCPERRLVRATI